ncbi:YraN family protein [Patescibacteria group bacterium]|nr:YraN family protein [Patescibacteria group bacterium]
MKHINVGVELVTREMYKGKLTENLRIGQVGEDVACRFLVKHGFSLVERNYQKKWGEIDIIARKGKILHFVEVKTVSRENVKELKEEIDSFEPEENVHPKKLKRMSRIIQTYLIEKNIEEGKWQFDVLAVFLDMENKQARVRVTENVII